MPTIREALDRHALYAQARGFTESAMGNTRRCVLMFAGFLPADRQIGDITTDDYRHFVADLRQRPRRGTSEKSGPRLLSGTTVNTYCRNVLTFFRWLKNEGMVTANPLASETAPKKPRTLPKVYAESDIRAFLKAVMPNLRNRAIVFLFLDTGLRLNEISQLTASKVNTREALARVMGKGQKERIVPLSPRTVAAVEEYVKNGRPAPRDTDRLFLNPDGRPLSGRGIVSMLVRLGREAGVKERLSPHKLRHTFATRSLKYGGNLEYIKNILGHADIKTTSEAYLNVDQADVKTAHQKFSPLSNLMDAFGGEGTILEQTGQPEGQPRSREGSSERGVHKASPSSPVNSLSTKQESTREHDVSTGGAERPRPGERPDGAEDRLRPTCRDLYYEHVRKLAVLAGELATDIETGHLEPRRHPAKAVPNSSLPGVDVVGVYHAQNSRLWPFLAQHLDNEFSGPRLTKQIFDVAVDAVVSRVRRFMKQASREAEFVGSVREKLVLVSERGTFEGACSICRNYFFDSAVGQPRDV
jgi:integrase/recombinase XerD